MTKITDADGDTIEAVVSDGTMDDEVIVRTVEAGARAAVILTRGQAREFAQGILNQLAPS